VWDALLSDRPYRPAWTRERALAHIRESSGTQLDPAVVQAFLAMVEPGDGLAAIPEPDAG
jgi:HD-GYP domain-containing protein (c-di-GMP phosphodiesterase class II)